MINRALAIAALMLLPLAHAQEIPPISVPPASDTAIQPVPGQPVNVPVTLVQPPLASVTGVTANLSSPLTLKGKATLVLTLKSTLTKDLVLSTNRDNRQNCAFAPSLRILRVGTREVVYPQNEPGRLCAQDMGVETLKAGGTLRYTRTLDLPAGEYMVEGWYQGLAGDSRVKIPAQPIRVTVK